MKSIQVIVFLLIVLFGINGSEDNPRLLAWFKNCQEQTGASNQDYEMIKMRKIPSTKTGVCMVQCLFKKLHIIDNNGQFNQRSFVITISPVLRGDLNKLSVLKEMASICQKEVEAAKSKEECSNTKTFLECIAKHKDKLEL